MSALFARDLWPPGLGSAITGNSALLRPNREPNTPRFTFGRVEGSISWPGSGGEGPEDIPKGELQAN